MPTIAELANHLNGVWHGDAHHAISGISSLSRAQANDLAYFEAIALEHILSSTQAGVVLLRAEHLALSPVSAIVVPNPYAAMHEASNFLILHHKNTPCIHPTAQIHNTARLGAGVSIGAHAFIDESVCIGDGVCIGANSVVEKGSQIGVGSIIGSGVILHECCIVGRNVILDSGCVIGARPFNYLKQHGRWQQGSIVGAVVISDGVHIGANTTIDSGVLSDTYIAQGVCVDNLVHIAHDAIIGAHTAIAACAAIGARACIGADCIIGGASSIAAEVHLAHDVVITGMSTVSRSISKSGIYSSGTLVHEHERWRRNAARFKRLDEYMTKLNQLERKSSTKY